MDNAQAVVDTRFSASEQLRKYAAWQVKRPLFTSEDASAKLSHKVEGMEAAILNMSPAQSADDIAPRFTDDGVRILENLCAFSSLGCRMACLANSGRQVFESTMIAKLGRTMLWQDRTTRRFFLRKLQREINNLRKRCQKKGLQPAVRLNGLTDELWEVKTTIIQDNPDVQFYDYTKWTSRCRQMAIGWIVPGKIAWPKNYHLTFSRSENTTDAEVLEMLDLGVNVAVPFATTDKTLPATWLGREVINADKHDLRFLDKRGVICGLKVKQSKVNQLAADQGDASVGKYRTMDHDFHKGFIVEIGDDVPRLQEVA